MPYLTLFYRLIVRPLRREPVRTGLTVLAVALGVAVVLAIELAGNAAAGSFRSSVETLAGDADYEVTAVGGVPPEALARLAALPYPLTLRPRIEDYAVLPDLNRTVPFLGVDMLSDAPPGGSQAGDSAGFQRDDTVWTGDGLPYRRGDRVRLLINDRLSQFTVAGVLGGRSGEAVVMDLAPATRALGRNGMLDRILVGAPAGDWVPVLRGALPGLTVSPGGSRTDENRRMLAAFRWNLRVLSYIALVVGAFLIYNTISVSVVRRRAEIGILRALGATRGGVRAAFVAEAACLGAAGALAGIALGRLMAESAVWMVASTVESLYVSSRPAPVALTWEAALLALAAGTGVAVLSALAPAWEGSEVAPVEAMARGRREHQARVRKWRELVSAAVLGAAAWMASRQPPVDGKPLFGYLAAVLMIAAATLAIPALVAGLSAATAGAMRRVFGVEALLAARALAGSLRRTSVLVGALATAIAMMAAVGIMVGSFRQTVLLWMEDRLHADLYLRPAGPSGADRHPTMSAEIPDRLAALPGVAAVDRFRAYSISYQGLPATLGGGEAPIAGRYVRRPFLSGARPETVYPRLVGADTVIVSEPFANKHGVRAGDVLTLPLGGRTGRFRVLDIYSDYSSERGWIIMDRGTLLRYLPDPAPSNVAVYLAPGVLLEDGRRAVEAVLAGRRVLVFSNRSLREEAIRVFDRTFTITYALEAVAVLVAVMGVAGALLALVIDRRREFALLRFLGGTAGQVRQMILFEAGLLGLLANVAGLILGVLLSLLLIYVINRQSFGWTIQFHWPVAVLVGALTVVYGATVLAGIYPARVATRMNPIEVIHEE
ncbi:MAG TPA: ABC transporter permease [Bryobacteraceae bacterium]|nr:ABC transporter permease [Bryobacteraceae bacterium]